jgi:hypothetical protein
MGSPFDLWYPGQEELVVQVLGSQRIGQQLLCYRIEGVCTALKDGGQQASGAGYGSAFEAYWKALGSLVRRSGSQEFQFSRPSLKKETFSGSVYFSMLPSFIRYAPYSDTGYFLGFFF